MALYHWLAWLVAKMKVTVLLFLFNFSAFSALTLLLAWQGRHPACIKTVWGEVQICIWPS